MRERERTRIVYSTSAIVTYTNKNKIKEYVHEKKKKGVGHIYTGRNIYFGRQAPCQSMYNNLFHHSPSRYFLLFIACKTTFETLRHKLIFLASSAELTDVIEEFCINLFLGSACMGRSNKVVFVFSFRHAEGTGFIYGRNAVSM